MASRVSSAYARCKSSKNELSDVYPGILYWIQYHPITAGRATRVDSTRSAYCGMFNMKPTMRGYSGSPDKPKFAYSPPKKIVGG